MSKANNDGARPGAMSDQFVPIAHFRNLQKEFANNLEAFERVSRQLDLLNERDGSNDDVLRALTKAEAIVDALLEKFPPGHAIDIGGLTYADLEVAGGAILAALLSVRR